MTLPCSWCGSWHAVKPIKVNGELQPSPIPGVPLHLCAHCWGVYRETGKRTGLGLHKPAAGPITGVPLTAEMLRSLRG